MKKIKIKNNLSIPMPVCLVGTVIEGKANFMAQGWATRVNSNPTLLAISIGKSHYTGQGIIENKCFSLSFPGKKNMVETDYCGIVTGAKKDKSKVFNLFYGELENAPMAEECPLCLELTLYKYVDLPDHHLIIGEIKNVYCNEDCQENGFPDYKKMEAFTLTMPDNTYREMGEVIGKAWSAGREFKE
jgi:flavin reductase (DIM6/NTAB) family NADH-FMN oxidoreductase RutF